MEIKFYQIDAFADEIFKGNPAGVCPLEQWISEDMMLKISDENNLSETAFFNGFPLFFNRTGKYG